MGNFEDAIIISERLVKNDTYTFAAHRGVRFLEIREDGSSARKSSRAGHSECQPEAS